VKFWVEYKQNELGLDNWILTKGHFYRGVYYTLNLGNGLPKDILKGVVYQKFGIAYNQRRSGQRRDRTTYNLSYKLFNVRYLSRNLFFG
jgi:transketolase N-terminal domain/subunit